MGLLLKVTSQPMEYMRMSEGGRLISSDELEAEQRRLLARRMTFGLRYGKTGAEKFISMKDRSDINRAFAAGSRSRPVSSEKPGSQSLEEEAFSFDSRESLSRYQTERGAFEVRVHRGDLAFIPPLVMTIITQYPEIHFEYTGGFNYVPPREDPKGTLLNLTG